MQITVNFDVLKKVCYMKQTVGVESEEGVLRLLRACDPARKVWLLVCRSELLKRNPSPSLRKIDNPQNG